MAPAATTTTVTRKDATRSPYQLDLSEVKKASSALVSHMKSEAKRIEANSQKKNLLADADENDSDNPTGDQPIWLIITTKKHIADQKRLKPSKIQIPHSLNSGSISICIITADPQRSFKDAIAHPSFPPELAAQIRVIGMSKLRARTKSFQEKRQLHAQYDVFLADDRVVTMLPKLLGKIFYDSPKRIVPIDLSPPKAKGEPKQDKRKKTKEDHPVAAPKMIANEITKALTSARVHISPSVTTAIHIGHSSFDGKQIQENVAAVVNGMVDKLIPKGWRNIKSIHVKGPNTIAFPLWMSSELWVDEEDVLENYEAKKAKQIGSQVGTKRKGREIEEGEESMKKKKTKLLSEEGFSKEMAERREKLRQANREARDNAANGTVESKITEVTMKPDGSKKKKIKKSKVIEVTAA